MTVKQLIKKLSKFDDNTKVLCEFDSDGDDFIVKVDVDKVYKGDGFDDSDNECDEDEVFCLIKLNY
jgi:hypothetical protein